MREFLAIPTLTHTHNSNNTSLELCVGKNYCLFFASKMAFIYVFQVILGNILLYLLMQNAISMLQVCTWYMTCKSILPAGLQFLKRKLNFPNILLLVPSCKSPKSKEFKQGAKLKDQKEVASIYPHSILIKPADDVL